jgi:hypothetical protein
VRVLFKIIQVKTNSELLQDERLQNDELCKSLSNAQKALAASKRLDENYCSEMLSEVRRQLEQETIRRAQRENSLAEAKRQLDEKCRASFERKMTVELLKNDVEQKTLRLSEVEQKLIDVETELGIERKRQRETTTKLEQTLMEFERTVGCCNSNTTLNSVTKDEYIQVSNVQ